MARAAKIAIASAGIALAVAAIEIAVGVVDQPEKTALESRLEGMLALRLDKRHAVDRDAALSIALGTARLRAVGYAAPECDPILAAQTMTETGRALSRTVCEARARVPVQNLAALEADVALQLGDAGVLP